ncbi:MAG: ComEA family DNA-binding protein [Tepidisphaerales bacterium]
MIWNQRQRVGLALIGFLIATILAFRLWKNRAEIADPMPPSGDRAAELVDRLDPNVADAGVLSAIPGLSRTVATGIVEYRQAWAKAGRRGPAFTCVDDLKNVKGIGDATARMLEGYLVFPATKNAVTRPVN